ncbi:MAG: hypothetical protein ACI9FR_002656 [Cryomorphaceae bacterium]|jgi:hypothetical protein
MQLTHFERIQICCEDVSESLLDYAKLLDRPPTWSGAYRLLEPNGELVDHGSCAWFLLENTQIELISSSSRDIKIGIVGIVMGHGDHDADFSFLADSTSVKCTYTDKNGDSFSEEQLCLTQRNREGFLVTVLKHASSLPMPDGVHDIKRVDHLVLTSQDADSCIYRFGEAGLGLRLALDKDVPEWGGRMLFFRSGKLTLEVIVSAKKFDKTDLFWGIAYHADDINLSAQRFAQNGVEFSEVRKGRKPNTLVSTIKSHALGIPTLLVQP